MNHSYLPPIGTRIVYQKPREHRASRQGWRGEIFNYTHHFSRFIVLFDNGLEQEYDINALCLDPEQSAVVTGDRCCGYIVPQDFPMKRRKEPTMNNGMNLHNAAALVRDDITTIEVVHPDGSKVYTYKVLRSLARVLKKDDMVIVKNKRGISAAKVYEVHDDPVIDVNAYYTYHWAFQRVDLDTCKRREHEDEILVSRLKERKTATMRDQVLAALGVDATQVSALLEQAGQEENGE